ncbi:hypothetical protein BDV59DRAFT_126484 [Aspergillus ambiguus]|uniref:uncharacterized protein n=1 Tax=Aspergillus ambiguus TaxID=176160 RepID=UPI003CCD3AEF
MGRIKRECLAGLVFMNIEIGFIHRPNRRRRGRLEGVFVYALSDTILYLATRSSILGELPGERTRRNTGYYTDLISPMQVKVDSGLPEHTGPGEPRNERELKTTGEGGEKKIEGREEIADTGIELKGDRKMPAGVYGRTVYGKYYREDTKVAAG